MTSCQGIQKVYKKNMYTLCTPGCTSLYPLSFNTKYVHPLYAQKGRECKFFFVLVNQSNRINWKMPVRESKKKRKAVGKMCVDG
jgi:hypothetical protein